MYGGKVAKMINHFLKGLCSDESTPETITLIENGTKTVLMKHITEEGVEYRGTPTFKVNGEVRRGHYPLLITPTGEVQGQYALNAIFLGGWDPKKSKDPGREARKKVIHLIKHALISSCVLLEQGLEAKATPLEEIIEQETGHKVLKTPMTLEQKLVIRTLKMKNHLVEILIGKGWSLDVSAETLVRKSKRYCKLVKGEWGAESGRISTTAALSFDQCEVLKELGYTLKFVDRRGIRNNRRVNG